MKSFETLFSKILTNDKPFVYPFGRGANQEFPNECICDECLRLSVYRKPWRWGSPGKRVHRNDSTREWSNKSMNNREDISLLARNNIIQVVFTKADGSERLMTCTLMDEHIPSQARQTESTETKKINTEVLPVWDMEKEAWRSFRIDSIKAVAVV